MSQFTRLRKNRCLQILRNTAALKLVPRPFRAQQILFFGLYINLTRARKATIHRAKTF